MADVLEARNRVDRVVEAMDCMLDLLCVMQGDVAARAEGLVCLLRYIADDTREVQKLLDG